MIKKIAVFTAMSAVLAGAPGGAESYDPAGIRESAAKTVGLLQKSGDAWKIPCVSCHHQGVAMMAIESARLHGIPVDSASVHAHAARTFRMFSGYESAVSMGVDTFAFGYGLLGAHAAGVKPNISTAIMTKHISAQQQPEGYWPSTDGRPPHSYSTFAATALSVRALSLYAPEQLAEERKRNFIRARKWFQSEAPQSTEDRTFRLLGLYWAGATDEERKPAVADLLTTQHADGGWGQEAGLASDAYATGEAIVALRQSGGITSDHPAFHRGIRYLLQTQNQDGSWLVKSRLHSPAQISPPFFDSGFPGGKDQFLSCAASAWAAMALMEALPVIPNAQLPLRVAEAEPSDVPEWAETVALGTVEQVRELLKSGLDPNSSTKNGITPLMLAAPDVPKMQLLISEGAVVTTQTKSGLTALNVAAGFHGSAPAVRLLIAHGAAANPKDVKLEATPLFAASTAGDADVLQVLLDHGVRVDRKIEAENPFAGSPLLSAVQMDSVELVRMMAKNGADLNERDAQEMTPLMWAALAHRTKMVKALIELGADSDAVDKYGYTALRHTSDIAGADPATADLLKGAKASEKRASVR